MNELSIFDYDGMQIETIMHDNGKGKTVPYFHGSSVAIVLGYEDANQAIRKNCLKNIKLSKLDIAKTVPVSKTEGTPYKTLADSGYSHGEIIAKQSWIPEPDVYRLIMKSTLPNAEKFQDWVCDEVLPSLRENGGYIGGQENMSDEELMAKAETVAIVLGYEDPTKAYKHTRHKVNVSYLDIEKAKDADSANISKSTEINSLPTPYQRLTSKGLTHNEVISKKTWVNEFDIYQMVMKSHAPNAEKFQDWVCEEVLPALRKDGMYVVGEEKVEINSLPTP